MAVGLLRYLPPTHPQWAHGWLGSCRIHRVQRGQGPYLTGSITAFANESHVRRSVLTIVASSIKHGLGI
jgi:hypothetical protein